MTKKLLVLSALLCVACGGPTSSAPPEVAPECADEGAEHVESQVLVYGGTHADISFETSRIDNTADYEAALEEMGALSPHTIDFTAHHVLVTAIEGEGCEYIWMDEGERPELFRLDGGELLAQVPIAMSTRNCQTRGQLLTMMFTIPAEEAGEIQDTCALR
ncbi:MAG: hypothetical protein AAFV53_01750 [Myxococcota bacterium]